MLAEPTQPNTGSGLVAVCTEVVERMLSPEAVQFSRLLIAEAIRFPELVAETDRVRRQRAIAAIAVVLPATNAAATLLDVVFAPLALRALLGEKHMRAQVKQCIDDAISMLGYRVH